MNKHQLDLRGIACPMNFVKTKLFLDKIAPGEILQVKLDEGEPVESVTASIKAEGHEIISSLPVDENHFILTICKV